MPAECECPTEHTITKLGHCRTCPYHGQVFAELEINRVTMPEAFHPQQRLTMFICGSRHADSTPHDFDWATYSDEEMSYGVCFCGVDSMTHALFTLP